ncbi:MAG: type II secretion system GspH family protein [Heliobacteriaceae bacterium]|jgi:prepilin-type N-terminal cleavage/methylation domain-containing protein|nr:type II secretion system GspH family protein [Heliobacteriaceae bacterium]
MRKSLTLTRHSEPDNHSAAKNPYEISKRFFGRIRSLRMTEGFTLAEVLITLGIIGVAAALTMPSLVQNYRKRVVETRLAKFYSVMNQAVKLSEVENGDKEEWEQIPTDKDELSEWYDKYLAKYIISTKTEAVILNFDDLTKPPNSDGSLVHEAVDDFIIYFSDGSAGLIGSTHVYFFPNAKDADILKSSNNYKGEAEYGKAMFVFHFYPNSSNIYHKGKGFEPYKWGWDGTEAMLRNDTVYGCNKNSLNEAGYCAALIQLNGWKIPDDYPFKF